MTEILPELLPLPLPEDIIAAHDLENDLVLLDRDAEGGVKYYPLGYALYIEAELCTGDPEKRHDPEIRATYLLGILASGQSLDEQFYPYLEQLFKKEPEEADEAVEA